VVGEVFNLLAALLSGVGSAWALYLLVLARADVGPLIAAGFLLVGCICWVIAAIAAIVDRRRP
jgi:hypothetical protein